MKSFHFSTQLVEKPVLVSLDFIKPYNAPIRRVAGIYNALLLFLSSVLVLATINLSRTSLQKINYASFLLFGYTAPVNIDTKLVKPSKEFFLRTVRAQLFNRNVSETEFPEESEAAIKW